MNHLNQEPLDFAAAVALMQIARAELRDALALLREINDTCMLTRELQDRTDAILDRADEQLPQKS